MIDFPNENPDAPHAGNQHAEEGRNLASNLIPVTQDDIEPFGEVEPFRLVGLTGALRSLEQGTGYVVQLPTDLNRATMRNLRNRISRINNRLSEATGDRFTAKTTKAGIEVWRLPSRK